MANLTAVASAQTAEPKDVRNSSATATATGNPNPTPEFVE